MDSQSVIRGKHVQRFDANAAGTLLVNIIHYSFRSLSLKVATFVVFWRADYGPGHNCIFLAIACTSHAWRVVAVRLNSISHKCKSFTISWRTIRLFSYIRKTIYSVVPWTRTLMNIPRSLQLEGWEVKLKLTTSFFLISDSQSCHNTIVGDLLLGVFALGESQNFKHHDSIRMFYIHRHSCTKKQHRLQTIRFKLLGNLRFEEMCTIPIWPGHTSLVRVSVR